MSSARRRRLRPGRRTRTGLRRCVRRVRGRRRGSRRGCARSVGTTFVIGTSTPKPAASRTIISRAAMCGSAAKSGARLISPTGTSCALEDREQVVDAERRGPARDLVVELALALGTRFVGRVVARQVGPAHRCGEPGEHRVGVARDHDVVAVRGRVRVRRRDVAQDAAADASRITPPTSQSATVDSISAITAS